jgi:hypothetical protein
MEWLGVDGWWLCGTGISFHRGGVGVDGIRLDNVQKGRWVISLFKGETPLDPPFACGGLLMLVGGGRDD